MKLRNKQTGEIKEVIVGGYPVSGKTKMWECSEMDANEETGYKTLGTYNSLAELIEEWEDYEEPKEYWAIDCFVPDGDLVSQFSNCSGSVIENRKSIGNYFETKEEAEKAVEKLKAWKRLKDNGFRFQFWTSSYSGDSISFFIDWINANSKKEIENDLDLLFGDEE